MIDAGAILPIAIELAALPGTPGREEPVVDYVLEHLRTRDVLITQDHAAAPLGGAGNLHVVAPGDPSLPRLLFGAHLDTLGDPSRPLLTEGRLTVKDGFFAADDRIGLAMLLAFLDYLPRERGQVSLLLTVAEEDGMLGAREPPPAAMEENDCAFVLDSPGPPGVIITQADAGQEFVIAIKTRAERQKRVPGVDPRWAANRLLARLPVGQLPDGSELRLFPSYHSLAEGIAFSGAAYAQETQSLENLLALAEVMCREVCGRYGLAYTFRLGRSYPGYLHAPNSAVVSLATAAARHVLAKPVFLRSRWASDANIYNAYGLPAVNLGSAWHESPAGDAWVDPVEFARGVEYLVALVSLAATRPVWQERRSIP